MGKRRQGLINGRGQNYGIVIAFSAEEWSARGELMDKVLTLPELRPTLEDSVPANGKI